MNEQGGKLDLKALDQHIEIKTSEILELKNSRNKYLMSLEEHENNINASCKTLFEKIIEILSIGFIKYDNKYTQIINELKSSILEILNAINVIDEDLKLKNEELFQLKKEFIIKLNILKEKLNVFQNNLIKLAESTYINDYTKTKLTIKLKKTIGENSEYLLHNSIKPSISELIIFIKSPKKWVLSRNSEFVKIEKIREKYFFDLIEPNPLTEKQKDAVLVNENNNLILAGAGSGKTSVIVAKVAYLLNKNIYYPNELLILAFNKNAQVELLERFKEKNLHVKIKTFHSFGLSVIAEAMVQKPDLCPMTESSTNMMKFIKKTIHKLMASMSVFLENFITFVAYFSIPYKSESEFNSLGEYYDYQKSYDMKTLKHKVEVKGVRQGENNLTNSVLSIVPHLKNASEYMI
jgi:DNA helicase-4